MKLLFLRYFCILAEELHFHRAASRLAISQPPLSAAIKSLEEELGAQLFLRNSKMVQLTPAGVVFLNEAREILERLSRVGGMVRAVEEGVQGRLEIGIVGSLMYREVPGILSRFKREMPGIDVVLHELSSAEHLERLIRKQLHAAFVHGSTAPPQLKSLALKNDTFVLCLPEGHPLGAKASVDLHEVAEESFVMFAREGAPANHDNVIAIFSRAAIHPRTVHQARTWLTIVTLVAQGNGVAIVPRSVSKAGLRGVCFVPLKGAAATAPAMMAWNPNFVAPALANFIESATLTIGASGKARRSQGTEDS
ncbi:LysR family transcriptional regulator [Variovorax sp. Sphag1AA]|uniref:LysR family transcriptional regulator n=1 Tax=Variovorax sp. Sphag1AA TaxID=2587027 RepID=UPI0016078FF3|nr:LysR family transcriptional regulator [Variovorax sp. Sphag1AA]MBB3181138.1 DNA-binding transcriptional LysR family regulator [Variovorax sp. Sphag1AA]